jgi:hypothetical protein
MCAAERIVVQVQLTEFEAENYPLAIQAKKEISMVTNHFDIDVQTNGPGRMRVSIGVGRGARKARRADWNPTRSTGSVIGANTLSIIGQIEPGRTVRLYRQIH